MILLTIPNLLTMLRILLVPAVAALYLRGYAIFALAAFIVAGATDMLDGYIARKKNLITSLGKIMDPVADKLLVITCLFCFYIKDGSVPLWLLCAAVGKEALMGLGSLFIYKRRDFVVSSKIYGKISAALFSLGLALTFVSEYASPYCLYALYAAVALSFFSMVLYAKDNLFVKS